jgi:DNA-binding NtrC family response regulator
MKRSALADRAATVAHSAWGKPALLVISGCTVDRRRIANLAARNFRVVEARDGACAIEILSTHAFDIVVLDLVLPRLRGIDFLAYYHARYPQRRNVVVIAAAEQLAAIESEAVTSAIEKPVDIAALAPMLRRRSRPGAAYPRLRNTLREPRTIESPPISGVRGERRSS